MGEQRECDFMAWKKRGNARNITEVIKEISRLSLEEVSNPVPISSLSIMEWKRRRIYCCMRLKVKPNYDSRGLRR